MQLEKRYIYLMSLCFAFLVFIYSSGGSTLVSRFISVPTDRTDLRQADYFADRNFSGTRYEKNIDNYFKKLDADVLKDTVIFYKEQLKEGPLMGGLALEDDALLPAIKDKQLKLLLDYGIGRINNSDSKTSFNTYDFRLGYKDDLYLRMAYSKEEDRLTIRDRYDTDIGYHEFDIVDYRTIKTSIIHDLPFLQEFTITKLPFSSNHLIVKAQVDDSLNFSKKEGFEKLLLKKTKASYVSVIYNHKGKVVDSSIADDPSIKSLFLHSNEILYYYTTEQMMGLLKTIDE